MCSAAGCRPRVCTSSVTVISAQVSALVPALAPAWTAAVIRRRTRKDAPNRAMLRTSPVTTAAPVSALISACPRTLSARGHRAGGPAGAHPAHGLPAEAHRPDAEAAGGEDLQAQPAVERDLQHPRV